MKKKSITRLLARQAKTSESTAADALDRVVCGIVRQLRRGKSVTLPGLGVLQPGKSSRTAPPKGARSDRG